MIAALLAVGPYLHLGLDLRALRFAVSPITFASLLVLTASILLRLRGERGRRRQELVSSAMGLGAAPALLAIVHPDLVDHRHADHPPHAAVRGAPVAAVGRLRADPSQRAETSAVLTRRMFVAPVLTGALVVAIIVWLALRATLRAGTSVALVPWIGAAIALLALIALGARVSGRLFFAATTRFRPTLQQLADDLASKSKVAEIGASIREAVMRWLPTEDADVLAPADLDRLPHRPLGVNARMEEGTAVWTTEPHWRRHLLVPMRSQGGLRGVLKLAPKHEAALYTREDLELLETIASLGAVALHNAEVFAELEAIRRLEAEVARDDKRLTLGMSAPMSHEIAYPLNFLRYLLREAAGGAPGRRARSRGRARGDRPAGTHVREVAQAAHPRAAGRAGAGAAARAARAGSGPRERRVEQDRRRHRRPARLGRGRRGGSAGPDPREPAPERRAGRPPRLGGRRSLEAERRRRGDGPRSVGRGARNREDIGATIFNPFVSTKQGGMGLGLAVTQRLVRGFGWNIAVRREEGRTVLAIEIPPARSVRGYTEAVS